MIANIKQITLHDGTLVSFEDRVGEYFQVKMGPKYYELIHQTVFFEKKVGVPGLLEILLKKEASIKRAEARAAKKAAVVEKPKADETKEVQPDVVGSTVVEPEEPQETDESGDFEAAAAQAEEPVVEEKPEKAAPKAKAEKVEAEVIEEAVVVEEVVDPQIKETATKAQSAVDDVVGELAAVAESAKVPDFEKPALLSITKAFESSDFEGCAKDKMLVIGAPDSEGFVSKIADWSEADKIYQVPYFKKDVPVFATIKAEELLKSNADVVVLSTAPDAAFEQGLNAIKGLSKGGTLFLIYATANANDATHHYSDYQKEAAKHDVLTIDVENVPLAIDKIVKNG